MAQFCGNCGAPQSEGMKFCSACGAAIAAPSAPVAQPPVAQVPAPQAPPPSYMAPPTTPYTTPTAREAPPAGSSGGSFLKFAVGCLGVIFVIGLVIAGAGAYFYYYHIKPKVAQIEKTVSSFPIPTGVPQSPTRPGGGPSSPGNPGAQPNNPASAPNPADMVTLLKQLGVKVPDNSPLAQLAAAANRPELHFPALTPGDPSVYSGPLVFKPGMTIALSISEPLVGDYDVLISVISVSDEGVTSNYSAQLPASRPGTTSPANAATLKSHMLHTDGQQDLIHAVNILPIFSEKFPALIPGATSFHLSQDGLRAIKSGSGIDLTFANKITATSLKVPANDFWSTLDKYTCHATRTEATDAGFPLLLNGQRVTLPAIHMGCPHGRDTGAEYVLDDEKMALFLAAWNGQLTQINYPPATSGAGGQSIEQTLKKEGHVDVYGIYFDFASDKLRPESAPVLAEIAAALKDNPGWKLHVNGHTDNIGGDAYNLDLSNRRAAAVKQALVTQYHIDAARLDPKGYGATQPKESNDTLQGRARNRRVELIRE